MTAKAAAAVFAGLVDGYLVLALDPAKSLEADIGAKRAAMAFLAHDAVTGTAWAFDLVGLELHCRTEATSG